MRRLQAWSFSMGAEQRKKLSPQFLVSKVNSRSTKVEPAMKYRFAVLAMWASISMSLFNSSPSTSQSSAAKLSVRDTREICADLNSPSLRVFEKVFTSTGLSYQRTADKELWINASNGELIAKVKNVVDRDFQTCVTNLSLLTLKSCRVPTNGVEGYGNEFDVTRDSETFSRRSLAGSSPLADWCSEVIASLRATYPQGNLDIVKRNESTTRNICPPLYCPQFVFRCVVHVKTDPIYNLKYSADCP
jgi:hypothetical protein